MNYVDLAVNSLELKLTPILFIVQELYGKRSSRFVRLLLYLWKNSFARLGEDWVYLALLGIIMALLSYIMDKGIAMCTNGESHIFPSIIQIHTQIKFTNSMGNNR